MSDDAKQRMATKQPDVKPLKGPPSSGLRGGAYKPEHDTPGNTWLHGGDPSTKPGYHKGRAGQQKLKRRWPY